MRSSNHFRATVALALLLALGAAGAETPPGQANANVQAALSRAQGLLRQLNEQKQQADLENAKLEAANAALEQELKHAKLETADREADLAGRTREASRLEARLAGQQQRIEQYKARLEDLVAKYKAQARVLAEAQAEQARLSTELATTRTELADAEKKNLALYEANRAVLDKYTAKSRWSALLQHEPFTGIEQVRLDSEAEALRRKMAEDLRDGNLDAAGK